MFPPAQLGSGCFVEFNLVTLAGNTISLSLPPNTTIAEVKLAVEDALPKSQPVQQLAFGGQILCNTNTIEESGISCGSTVQIVFGLQIDVHCQKANLHVNIAVGPGTYDDFREIF